MDEVGSTIDRVDDPVVLLSPICTRTLLGDITRLWEDSRQALDEQTLRVLIHLSHEVVLTLNLHLHSILLAVLHKFKAHLLRQLCHFV